MIRTFLIAALVAGLRHPLFAQESFERGKFKDGKPVGVWEYYDGKELALLFDYDSSRIQYLRLDTARYSVLVDSVWQTKRLSRAPRLLGSKTAIVSALQRQLRYPSQTTGTVILTYVVDPQGQVINPVVTTAPSQTLAEEVFRVTETLPLRYLPAMRLGKPVASKIAFVVRFRRAANAKDETADADIRQQEQLHPSPPGSFNDVIVTAFTGRR